MVARQKRGSPLSKSYVGRKKTRSKPRSQKIDLPKGMQDYLKTLFEDAEKQYGRVPTARKKSGAKKQGGARSAGSKKRRR